MTNTSQIEKTWLSHVRHELRTPVNIILGYSEIIIEDLAESPLSATVLAEMQAIHSCGQQILSLVNTLSDSDYVEFSENKIDISHIRLKFQTPLKTIFERVEQLLATNHTQTIHDDLEKIYLATNNLVHNINGIINLSVNQPGYPAITRDPVAIEGTAINPTMVEDTANTITTLVDDVTIGVTENQQFEILIVDDKETNRALLSRRLHRQGYRAATAQNGRQALQSLEDLNYDLILLDILMPEMNGYEVLQRLKAHELWRNIPVIMISALHEIDSVVKCIQLGAEDYLAKPFNPVLLRARIGACLEKKRLRDQEQLYLQKLAQAHEEIVRVNRELERMAKLDGLTQVANRRHFDDCLRQEWQRCLDIGQPLALILLDVDYFKRYNDYYGHLLGDDCLRMVAQAIAQSVPFPDAVVARYGGEEFAVILPQLPLPAAQHVAQTICDSIRNLAIAHVQSDAGAFVTVSLGVTAVQPTVQLSPELLIQQADRALYAAKHQGRNRVVRFDF